ncbi:hypothetical protein ABZ904_48075, partial [Streptomyces sp. NPDC046900]|uniref:hypothetical protein n=1 Tax=Streptomyces sp. NPDC046900 TaxID=3155473 RepID=UPI0033ED818B
TLEEDQDDQKIAKWVTVHPPISGPFSPVAETSEMEAWALEHGKGIWFSPAGDLSWPDFEFDRQIEGPSARAIPS